MFHKRSSSSDVVAKRSQQRGIGDQTTFHFGCDPADGEQKYMANQWIRNKRVLHNGKWVLYDEVW